MKLLFAVLLPLLFLGCDQELPTSPLPPNTTQTTQVIVNINPQPTPSPSPVPPNCDVNRLQASTDNTEATHDIDFILTATPFTSTGTLPSSCAAPPITWTVAPGTTATGCFVSSRSSYTTRAQCDGIGLAIFEACVQGNVCDDVTIQIR